VGRGPAPAPDGGRRVRAQGPKRGRLTRDAGGRPASCDPGGARQCVVLAAHARWAAEYPRTSLSESAVRVSLSESA
jgi:hypothetical protein